MGFNENLILFYLADRRAEEKNYFGAGARRDLSRHSSPHVHQKLKTGQVIRTN